MTIVSLYEKVQAMNTDVIIEEAIEETAGSITEENKKQMLAGKTASGAVIGEYRNELYAEVKNRMNPLPGFGVPDLKLTGSFQSKMGTNVIGDSIITESTDTKNQKLREKYGDGIFILGGDFKREYMDLSLRPALKQKIESATGLRMQ